MYHGLFSRSSSSSGGSRCILPDKTWLPRHSHIRVRLLPPLSAPGTAREHAVRLRDVAREAILKALSAPI